MLQFNHFNFNVLDLERSLAFYRQALELEVEEEKEADDGSFKLVYLGDGETGFRLELTAAGPHRTLRFGGAGVPSGLRHRPL